MKHAVMGLAAGLWCSLAAAPLWAQNPGGLNAEVTGGVRHYQQLKYDSAVVELRHALAGSPGDSLNDSVRARALTYLAASELFRGRRDSALAAFRRLVTLNPRARPDSLVFPPEVQNIYEFARDVTKIVAVQVPRDTSIRLGADRYLARLYASSLHQIIVTLEREDGFTVRTLYAGPISDTLQVFWSGEDTLFFANDTGRLMLNVTSLVGARQSRIVRLPLDLVLGPQDTLPTPPPLPDSLFLPEHQPAGPGFRSLGRGAGIGLAVALLPGIVAGGDAPSGSRFAVAGGLTLAGIIGFFAHRPGKPLPDNIIANQALRDGYQAQIQMTAQENAIRVLQKRLDIHAGRPEVMGGRR